MAILNTHKKRTDNVRIVDMTNVAHQETKTKKRNFGIFTEQDFVQSMGNLVKSSE